MQPTAHLVSILCIALLSHPVLSTPIQGLVTDETGEPLPFVSVYLQGSTQGVATDLDGKYKLEVTPGTYQVVYQMMGFDTQTLEITVAATPVVKNVIMVSTAMELAGVTIMSSGKDPAYAIIENAMAVRKQHLEAVRGYTRTTYVRLTSETYPMKGLQVDTVGKKGSPTPLNFVEAISTTHFERPNKIKEIKTAYRDLSDRSQMESTEITGLPVPGLANTQNPFLFYQDAADADFNFYLNTLSVEKLSDLPFLSPIGVGALLAYKYELLTTEKENGQYVHTILVTPRNNEGALFSGTIQIEDETWAIRAVDLEINPGVLIYLQYFRITQQYQTLGPGQYIPVQEDFYYHGREDGKLVLSHTTASHQGYEINPSFGANFFGNELRRFEEDALEKEAEFWEAYRPVALAEDGVDYMSLQDSLNQYYTSDAYKKQQDSLYNITSLWEVAFSGFGQQNSFTGWRWYMDGVLSSARPVMPGGYHHALGGGVRKEFDHGNQLEVRGRMNYGFRNKDLTGSFMTRYRYLPKKSGEVYFRIGDEYSLLGNLDELDNILSRSNYILQSFAGVGHKMEFFNGFTADVSLNLERQRSIANIPRVHWHDKIFGRLPPPKNFRPFNQLIFEATVSYTPGMKYYTDPYRKVNLGSDFPTFTAYYRRGLPGAFGSQADFDFLELSVAQSLNLKYMGTLNYTVFGGKFLSEKNVQFVEYRWFQGATSWLLSRPLMTSQLLKQSVSTQGAYVQGQVTHHFNGALMNKVPLVNKLGLQVGGGAGFVWLEENNFSHAEAFIGLEKPFVFLKQRVRMGAYYAASLNSDGPFTSGFKIGGNLYNPFTKAWLW
ncbi:MAG: DUF5686 and carboxypeptidase regulatory-like domain-containing protein [Bacteroidota bacterium]